MRLFKRAVWIPWLYFFFRWLYLNLYALFIGSDGQLRRELTTDGISFNPSSVPDLAAGTLLYSYPQQSYSSLNNMAACQIKPRF